MLRGGVKTALFTASAIVYLYSVRRNASARLNVGYGAFLRMYYGLRENPAGQYPGNGEKHEQSAFFG